MSVSPQLFDLKPEVLRDKSRAGLNHVVVTLRLLSEALARPDLTLKDARELLQEWRLIGIPFSCAINEWEEAQKQQRQLKPALELFDRMTGEQREEAA